MRPSLAAAIVTLIAVPWAGALAQLAPVDPDWRETEVPPPPALKVQGLVPLEMPGTALRFGVQADSMSIGADRIVRYVVVATSSTGAVNAMYEGLRCSSGDFKVYARHNPDSGWVATKDFQWRSLHEQPVSRHSLIIARTGACIGHGTNTSAQRIIADLKAPAHTRFRGEMQH
jgi:hypothetical protein